MPDPSSAHRVPDNVAALIDAYVTNVRAAGTRTLIVHEHRSVTGEALADRIERTCHALLRRGMEPGDVVWFAVRPGIDALVTFLAAIRLGACVTFADLSQPQSLTSPRWVIAESVLYVASARTPFTRYLRRLGLELPRIARIPSRHICTERRLPGMVPRGALTLRRLQTELFDPKVRLPPHVAQGMPSTVVYPTSPSAATHGVQHTGGSIVATVQMMIDGFGFPADAVIFTRNLYGFVAAGLQGMRCIVAPTAITPKRFVHDVDRHGITHAFVLPEEARRIAAYCAHTKRTLPACLRQLVLLAAPVADATLEDLHRHAGSELSIVCIYSTMEMNPIARIESREQLAWDGDGELIGRPFDGVDVRIDDGELIVRGPNLFLGYVDSEPVRWHHTGVRARIDEQARIVLAV